MLQQSLRRKQIIIFFLTYFTHSLSEFGATNELITATFYKQ